MIYLLRFLLTVMVSALGFTAAIAFHLIESPFTHIQMAIVSFLFTIFIQAFVMFYFIGVSRLSNNIYLILFEEINLDELFENAPKDLSPYLEKAKIFSKDTTRCKRQTIPWTMLILVLGTLGFLLGGAHDTNLVQKTTHSGVIYGFFMATVIGFVRQWYFLGLANKTLRKIKTLFSIPDGSM